MGCDLRMTGWLDEKETSMYTVIYEFESVDTVLLFEVCVESSFNVVDNGFPTVHDPSAFVAPRPDCNLLPFVVVDKVTETRGVDDRKLQPNAILFDIYMTIPISIHQPIAK